MKIDILKNKIVLYLKKEYTKCFDYNNIDEIELYFKEIILKLNKLLKTRLYGFYILNIFVDKYYGSVIEIIDENEIYDLDEINLQINIINADFLYETEVYNKNDNYEQYLCKNKIYLKLKNNPNKVDMLKLLEFSKIIYDTEDIIFCSKKI